MEVNKEVRHQPIPQCDNMKDYYSEIKNKHHLMIAELTISEE